MSFSVNPWKVVEYGWDPAHMRECESLTTLGNGYMGMRGSFEEDYSGDSWPGMYLGGIWYPVRARTPKLHTGTPGFESVQLNAVKVIGIHVTIDGTVLDLNRFAVWEFLREVDMRTGVLHRMAMIETDKGSLKLECWRFVSMATPEVAAMRYTLTPSFDAKIGFMPYLDGDVRNEDIDECLWTMEGGWAENDAGVVTVRAKPNVYGVPRYRVSAAQVCRVDGAAPTDQCARPGFASTRFVRDVRAGETVALEKYIAVCTSRNRSSIKLPETALETAGKAKAAGWDRLLDDQVRAWGARWDMADVLIEGDASAQQGIHFNLFHLLSAYTGEDPRLNVSPRGFSGETFGGATYWDTEIWCLPVYMSVGGQESARRLLMYRQSQLAEAHENAVAQGLPGALYPMATQDGRECCGEWESALEEVHRNAAIVYAIYNYTNYTGDESFALNEGLPVVVGVARFWAGRVKYNARTGKYMILGVTGPNNYEVNVNNNWYTNRMAAWCLRYCLELCRKAGTERVAALFGMTAKERAHMRDIADNMYYPEDEALGIFVQSDGFLDKDLIPAREIPPAQRPVREHWSWDRVLRSGCVSQADVLQGLYLLEHLYDKETLRRNFDFYEPLTLHESGLSASIHCVLACAIGERDKAAELYRKTVRIDLDNVMGNTREGLHVTSMAGSWLAVTQGFAGMRTIGGLSFAPFLPDTISAYAFAIHYRGRVVALSVREGKGTLTLLSGEPLTLKVYGRSVTLKDKRSFRLR